MSIWAGVAAGAEEALQYHREAPERDIRRKTAEMQQQKAQMQLAEYQAQAPVRRSAEQVELAEHKAQLRKLHAESLQSRTDEAFRMYDATGDITHLNNFLSYAKTNPIGQRIYQGSARVDALTRTPETERMLAAQGVTDMDEFFADPTLANSFAIETNADGSQELVDLNGLKVATGYTQRAGQAELQRQLEEAKLRNLIVGPQTAETRMVRDIAKQRNVPLAEAQRILSEAKRAGMSTGGSAKERLAQQLMQDARDNGEILEIEEATRRATELLTPRTTKSRDVGSAHAAKDALDEMNFFEADLNDPVVRRKMGRHIDVIEEQGGKKLSAEDKRVVRDLRNIANLGKTAGEQLTDEETGILDSMLHSVKKYLSDEVGGTAGISSYETFRNLLRNALYGASLTGFEITAFSAASGSLKEKTGPVLAKLRTQIQSLKNQMEAVYDLNDEYVARYYLGRSREEIDEVIQRLDERIKLFSREEEGPTLIKPEVAGSKPEVKPGERKPLNEIFGR